MTTSYCSKANVNAENVLGKKPLHLAADRGHADIVEALLDAGTQVRQNMGPQHCTYILNMR